MAKISGGFTIWARQTVDSEIFFYKPDKWFKIWFFIVSRVNFKDEKAFSRGEGLITYEEIINKTRASKAQVHKCIKFLEKENMLGYKRTTRGMVRKVNKYGHFQDIENYRDNNGDNKREHGETTSGQLKGTADSIRMKERKNNITNVMETPSPRSKSKSLEETETEAMPINQDIDRSFPRKRLYGDEATNYFLDYWEHKMPNAFLDGEKWARIYVRHFKGKIGLGKLKEMIDWVSNPDCWWYSKLTGFKMLYYQRDKILARMEEPQESKKTIIHDITNL